MGDAVTTNAIVNETTRYVAQFTNICDTSGESGVKKIDKSALTDIHGREPRALDLLKAEGTVNGFTYVLLEWDHSTNDTMLVLAGGNFDLDFTDVGGVRDPTLYDGTGDILLTTAGNASGDTYDIKLTFRLRPDD